MADPRAFNMQEPYQEELRGVRLLIYVLFSAHHSRA